jgi:hypothetical protein
MCRVRVLLGVNAGVAIMAAVSTVGAIAAVGGRRFFGWRTHNGQLIWKRKCGKSVGRYVGGELLFECWRLFPR